MHDVAPADEEKELAGHCEHDAAPAREKKPGLQAIGEANGSEQKLPAGQSTVQKPFALHVPDAHKDDDAQQWPPAHTPDTHEEDDEQLKPAGDKASSVSFELER